MANKRQTRFLGIDIGGANLKYSDENGSGEIIYFPMWKNLNQLKGKLEEIKEKTKPEAVGAVITAELSDAFKNKSEGINFISSAVKDTFERTYFLSIDGVLSNSIDDPLKYSASNWVASVLFLKEKYDSFLFVDVGSTTSDFIPIKGEILAAKTDFERMKKRELIYIGALRTPVCCLLPEYDGLYLSAELFAIVADAFILTGDISQNEYAVETPDGRGKSREECLNRLARMFCADIDEIGESFIIEFAEEIKRKILKTISETIERHLNDYNLETVIGCGVGEFLIEEAMKGIQTEYQTKYQTEYVSLRKVYGKVSDLFPSFAMANLVAGKVEMSKR
jgi:hypothetical protein